MSLTLGNKEKRTKVGKYSLYGMKDKPTVTGAISSHTPGQASNEHNAPAVFCHSIIII
jgi:hypothetical protein